MIAITFALPSESLPLVRRFRHQGETAVAHALLGNLGLHECLLIHTGLGPERTRRDLLSALEASPSEPTLLISGGYAGALATGIASGSLFLAENRTDAQLLPIAKGLLTDHRFPLHTGPLHTTSNLIELPEEKADLHRRTGAHAVDMETEAIAAICARRDIPMVSLRAISDNATDPIPVPFTVCIDIRSGKPRPFAIAQHLALHPWRIPSFLQFAKRATQSREELARAIATLLPHIQPL